MFFIMDVSTSVFTAVNAPPFPASGTGNATNCVWDGVDTLYVTHGSSSTAFAKYNVLTNTWTALANLPSTPNGLGDQFCYEPLYIPAGTITGVSTDEIWFLLNTDQNTSLRRYSVTSNTYATLVVPAAPVNTQTRLVWDRQRYVYFQAGAFTYAYVLDLQNIGLGWTSVPFCTQGLPFGPYARYYFNEVACRVRSHTTLPTTYHFVGDANGVTFATKVNGHTWFARFGSFTTYRATTTANLSAPLVGGGVETAIVDSSNGFFAGDHVNIVDRATGQVAATTIISTPSATSVTLNVPSAMGATAYITTDGANCALFSDHFFAVTSMGVGGISPDSQPQLYRVVPTIKDRDIALSSASSDGRKQLWPFEMQWSVQGQANYGKRGTIPNIFLCDGVDGEVITDRNGDQYLVMASDALRMFTNLSSSKLAIGPIN